MALDISAEHRLMLGTVGWSRPDWDAGYYPPDLPPAWRLAYYANEADCVLLDESAWRAAQTPAWREALAEAPAGLAFFLRLDGEPDPAARRAMECFADRRVALLVERPCRGTLPCAQWRRTDDGWLSPGGEARLVLWRIDRFDLRALRAQAAALAGDPPAVALVLDGPGANPGRLAELRTLCELLGLA